MTKGRSIRLFLADGTPGGVITAEIMNWTGHVMSAPRSRLADLIQRPEAAKTGIYFLLGDDPNGGHRPMLYVGESDVIDERLRTHGTKKEFWDRVCAVTSKDHNLTKAHVKYLESRLIQIATDGGRVVFDNETKPNYTRLPESDIADMEFFIEQIRIVLPVLGMDFLRAPLSARTAASAATLPLFELASKKHELMAQAREIDGEFVVLAGSHAQAHWIGATSQAGYQPLHQRLTEDETLVPDPSGHLLFAQDTAFQSPSAAAAVVLGRSSNGRTAWRIKGTQTTYAAWQDSQVNAIPPSQEDEE